MKRFSWVIINVLTTIFFVGCDIGITPIINKTTTTDKSINFEFEELNEKISGTLNLNSGDTIEAVIDVKKGSYSIKVEGDDKEIPYEGDNTPNGKFSFKTDKKDTYTFFLNGENASGNISFKKMDLKEDKNKNNS